MSQRNVISPRTLKGFKDVLPEEERVRQQMVDRIRRSFESFGYAAFDTPVLEYAEVLLGKGSDESDKQMFRFTDSGGREVGLRFDLTVPLARFVALHDHELNFPFRAYHIGNAYRGERPQRGRFREFLQCDADVVGSASSSTDLEIVTMFASTIEALAIGEFRIRVNDRRVLASVLERLEISDKAPQILRSLDKRDKIGPAAVADELVEIGVDTSSRKVLMDLISDTGDDDIEKTLDGLHKLAGGGEHVTRVVDELSVLPKYLASAGIPTGRVIVDPSIVRGLDYYTGLVFETELTADPQIGSIASGGRYDNLTGLYTNTKLPGVGASIGIDRILASDSARLAATSNVVTKPLVVLVHSGEETLLERFQLASALRATGIAVDLYPDPKPHGAQLKYAGARNAALAVTLDGGNAHIRNLLDRSSTVVPADNQLAGHISQLVGGMAQ